LQTPIPCLCFTDDKKNEGYANAQPCHAILEFAKINMRILHCLKHFFHLSLQLQKMKIAITLSFYHLWLNLKENLKLMQVANYTLGFDTLLLSKVKWLVLIKDNNGFAILTFFGVGKFPHLLMMASHIWVNRWVNAWMNGLLGLQKKSIWCLFYSVKLVM
jgi:hypothetical protein